VHFERADRPLECGERWSRSPKNSQANLTLAQLKNRTNPVETDLEQPKYPYRDGRCFALRVHNHHQRWAVLITKSVVWAQSSGNLVQK
jgi:hypothetical protein